MLYGPPSRPPSGREENRGALVPLAACLAAVVGLGLYLPAPLARVLALGAEIVSK